MHHARLQQCASIKFSWEAVQEVREAAKAAWVVLQGELPKLEKTQGRGSSKALDPIRCAHTIYQDAQQHSTTLSLLHVQAMMCSKWCGNVLSTTRGKMRLQA